MKVIIWSTIAFLLVALFVGSTVSISTLDVEDYDPWYDFDDDGDIDIYDIVDIANRYGTSGVPFSTKAAIEHDSGWINTTDKVGQYFNVTHNLNNMDIMVDIQGKTTIDGGVHQRHLGGTGYTPWWDRTYGGTENDDVWSGIQVIDGYALAGHTRSFGAGLDDFWLVKTDVAGDMQWSQTYGGMDTDIAMSMVQTGNGGYAVVGHTDSFGAGGDDFWLIETDSVGVMQWNRTYGGINDEMARCVIETSDGGYALAGYTRSFGAGMEDFWLIKTDSMGNMQWNKTYGGLDHDYCSCVIETVDGGYALAGQTYSFGAGNRDMWLIKTDATGVIQWDETYGGTEEDFACSIIEIIGGYMLAGATKSIGMGQDDFWLVKTDTNGNIQWNRTYGGTNHDICHSLTETTDNGYVMAGQTFSLGAGGSDFWVVKTDSMGNVQWNETYGGAGWDNANSLVETTNGGYAIVGPTSSFGAGGDDFWLVKIDATGNALTGFKYGLAWTDSTADTITLYRGTTDTHWNYVRVYIWRIKETP